MRWLAALALALLARPAGADALAAKADAFLAAIHARHLSSEGLFLYNVDLRTIDRELASGAYPAMADGPTFNGLFAAASCAHAEAATGDERAHALADAETALSGLELLIDVTGERGLLARSARRAPPAGPDTGDWHAGSGRFEGWYWRGDVSQDQYANGLIPAVGLCRRLFPERARRLAVDAASNLVPHDFQLVDPGGRRTTYGDLSPTAGFGWNGIGQLTGYAIVALAAALDPDDAPWPALRDRLRDRDRMVARARFTNVRLFGITDYSNDLMAFDLYRVLVPLARETGDDAEADLRAGLWRSWLRVRHDRNPYFALVFCELEPDSCPATQLAEIHDALADFPAEKRKLGRSAELAALPRRWLPARKWEDEARDLVPMRLRPASSFEWKSSPYRVTDPVDPSTEYTGLDYLVAYWLYDALCRARPDCPAH
ncbi:MAG TPA: hypothetical protein VEN47_12175 [Myxococcota bacterium]|nr:hypothetical protein [Myxococcota bacterium]